jgi:hypothetical protein
MTLDPTTLVTQQLALAGITPRPDEVAALVATAPARQAAMDAMYAVPEARYEEPGLVFSASSPG